MKTSKTCVVERLPIISLEPKLTEALDRAHLAATTAYAPYSHFHVGAAAVLKDGTIIQGNNQENAAYPSGLCAERVTVFNAKANHSSPIVGLAISVITDREMPQELTPPCGACLQVLSDIENRQKNNISIVIKASDNEVFVASGVKQFLPFSFEL